MKRIIRTIDEQKRIAKTARIETIKELLSIFWEVIRAIGIAATFFLLVVKLPLWIGKAFGYGEIEIASMYAKIFCVIFVIAVLWFVASSIYERNYRRIANRFGTEQKEDSSELNLHNSKNCMYCGKQLVNLLDINNPEDYGLHTPYLDFSDKVVCTKCDFVVTQTDRLLKAIIDGKDRERDIKLLEEHISYFPEFYDKKNQMDMEV